MSPKPTKALAAVCLSSLMFGLEISSVPAALPTLQAVLDADFGALQWIMNAYTLAVTAVLMATGALADRFGRKRIFLGGIIAFGLSSLVCGLARDAQLLIVARFLQGASGGAMLICQVAILSHQFRDGRDRSHAFGWWGVIFGIGLGFGPIIGGAIVSLADWRWVFLVHGPLALATLVLGADGVTESRDPIAQRLDLAGIITLSISVFCLVYFITQGPHLGFGSPTAILFVGAAVVAFAAFIGVERSSKHPMFDTSVFAIRDFSGALLGSAAMNFSFWPFMIYLPIYFQAALGYDSVQAGAALLAYTLPTLAVPPLAERLALRYRSGLVIPAGLFVIGLGFILMFLATRVGAAAELAVLPGCMLAGVGLGLTNTTVTNATTNAVTSDRAGMASSIDMSARMISLAINIALMGAILVSGVQSSLSLAAPASADIRALAERVAAGAGSDQISLAIARQALVHGFGWTMLYGGLAAWILAAASRLTFGPALAARPEKRQAAR